MKLDDAAALLKKPGAVGVIPTDTVYGVVARASDQLAVDRLYKLKKRESKPGPIIAASIDQLVDLGIKRRYLTAVEQFWPGPVSVIVPHHISYLSQGVSEQPVRIPNKKDVLDLLKQTGPLLTSSANLPTKPVSVNVDQAKAYFGKQVDFYVDGGDLSGQEPSTIIRIIDDAIDVIRQGAVKISDSGKISL